MKPLILTLIASIGLMSSQVWAGLNEGIVAYGNKNYPLALREFVPLANKGNAEAQTYLGVMYSEGLGVSLDHYLANNWFRRAAQQGFAEAQSKLGKKYLSAQGVPQDYSEAFKWLLLAAEKGNASGQHSLGSMYHFGMGMPVDYQQAFKWYLRSAEQGNDWAQYKLGWLYADGLGVPQNLEEAAKWYRLAAEKGHTSALHDLDKMYAKEAQKEAVKGYRLAAEQGNAAAQYNLGESYFQGNGVAEDLREAIKWYHLAAKQGNANAQLRLGMIYDGGLRDVQTEYKEAVSWYRLAADQGSGKAQNRLAIMYANGRGVPESRVITYALLSLSAINDPSSDNNAIYLKSNLAERMSAREINAAEHLIREIGKTGNVLKALDQYEKRPAVKEVPTLLPAKETAKTATSMEPFPVRPTKVLGRVSCNTHCISADCYRTYDDGRKIRFKANQKWNPFENRFEFDSGSC